MQSQEPDADCCCRIHSSARIPANRAAAHCHLVPQIEGETSLSSYTPQSSCFFSSHSMGRVLISTNSKRHLPQERWSETQTGKHLSTTTQICTKTSERHTDSRQLLRAHGGADSTCFNPGDQPDTESVHRAATGPGIRTSAGGSDLQLQPWGHCSGTYRWAPRLGSPDGF